MPLNKSDGNMYEWVTHIRTLAPAMLYELLKTVSHLEQMLKASVPA
jgi:hypothetical protein